MEYQGLYCRCVYEYFCLAVIWLLIIKIMRLFTQAKCGKRVEGDRGAIQVTGASHVLKQVHSHQA